MTRRARWHGAIACLLAVVATHARARAPEPDVAAYVVQVKGEITERWHADSLRQPASLAKLALALVVAGSARAQTELARPITVSARAAGAPFARLGLRAGDRVRAGDLLRAMIVASANDACMALAEDVPGGVAGAVARMNALARDLGMRSTRFVDPCGFDRPRQATTAGDLLRLANASVEQPLIAAAAAERSVAMVTLDDARELLAATSNALLTRRTGIVGLKTGLTRGAGPSAIVVAHQGNAEVIVVVLGAKNRWETAERLLARGFERAFSSGR